MKSVTYQTTSKGRGCEEFGPHHLTYTDEIFADGRIVSTVKGYSDGEIVNVREECRADPAVARLADGTLDFDRIDQARRANGWTRLSRTL